MAAILESYFRFAIWSYSLLCDHILSNFSKFNERASIQAEVGRHLGFVIQCHYTIHEAAYVVPKST